MRPLLRTFLLPLALLVACDDGADGKETGPSFEGPTLEHTVPDAVVEGTALSIEVTATDPDDVASVTLYHRVIGETTWVQAPMIRGEDDAWSAALEATDVDDPGLEYYFKAEDAAETPASTYLPADSTAAPFELTVTVLGQALPFFEGFEHEDGDELSALGWGNASLGFRGYAWETSTSYAYEGSRSAFHSRGHTDASEMEDWLISPALDLTGVSTAQVTWRERGVNVGEANHGLYVSTGHRDPTEGEYVAVAELLPAPSDSDWARSAVYDLSAYAGEPTVYLAWRFVGQAADDWYIDDVRVDVLSPDLVIDAAIAPAPIEPGDTGTFSVTVDNVGTVDASGLTVSVSFPEGGASVAEGSADLGAIAAGGTAAADLSLTIDATAPDNSYLPYEITVTDGASSWSAEGELLVGYASFADITWTPAEEGAVELSLGVGDPDAPTWEEVVYDGTSATPVVLSLDITEHGAMLPPAAGDLRWFLRVNGEVSGTIDDFTISHDGDAYEATVLPRVTSGVESVAWLPEPPSFDVTATTSPVTLAPGDAGATLGLYVTNDGAATQGPVLASLSSADPDVTVHDGGPVALTDDVLGAGASVNVAGLFSFDVSSAHVDSSALALDLTLDDGVESWTVPLELEVPYPYLTITDTDIDDDGRDGELDPDEEAEVSFQLTNAGDLSTDGDLSAVLSLESTSTASATISSSPGIYRTLLAGRSDTPDDPWTIQVNGGAEGDTLDLLLTVTDDARTYEIRTTLRLGEPPWESFDASGDPEGDAVGGWDFDIVGGQWRVDDGILQLRFESAAPYDPDTLFIESWGFSTVSDWTLYRIVLQSGVATLEGYDSGFTTIGAPVVSYPSETVVQLDITLADMGLSLDTLSLGFASGWCGPPEYYCDHFPDGWGYPYDAWYSSLFFDLTW